MHTSMHELISYLLIEMAVGEVVADAMRLVILAAVKEGLDVEEQNERDGEFTLLLILLLTEGACARCNDVA